MTLNERINLIRVTLQKPFHFFTLLHGKSIKTSLVILVLEDEGGNRFSFQGNSIIEAIDNAEKYIEGEKKMGSLRDKSKDKEEIVETTDDLQENEEENNNEEKQEGEKEEKEIEKK